MQLVNSSVLAAIGYETTTKDGNGYKTTWVFSFCKDWRVTMCAPPIVLGLLTTSVFCLLPGGFERSRDRWLDAIFIVGELLLTHCVQH